VADHGEVPELAPQTRLETPRLVIRTFKDSDSRDWLALVNDPDVNRYLPPGPDRTPDDFANALTARHAMEREHGFAMWAVEEKATGAFVGQCGLRPVDEGGGPEIDLAYHYAPASWGRGYASEAVVVVLGHGLRTIGLNRIMAVAMAENVGSWRVMEKTGMRYEGIVSYYGLDGLKKYHADRIWWKPPAP
jgi:RimJ/RimL family protein N-acetyltransferase